MRRAWTWFRSHEGWAQASLASATIAVAFFFIYQLPAFITGDQPLTPSTLWGQLLISFLIYFWCLYAWGAGYRDRPNRRSSSRLIAGFFIAFEAIALSIDAVLTAATTLVRRLIRSVRS